MRLDIDSITPGMMTIPSAASRLPTLSIRVHGGIGALEQQCAGPDSQDQVQDLRDRHVVVCGPG